MSRTIFPAGSEQARRVVAGYVVQQQRLKTAREQVVPLQQGTVAPTITFTPGSAGEVEMPITTITGNGDAGDWERS